MAWSFRRRVKVIPGVYLNISKSGFSTSVGIKGASLTFKKDGVYANVGIPGTGISSRQKISSKVRIKNKSQTHFNQKNENNLNGYECQTGEVSPFDNIFSSEVSKITSQDMMAVKKAIIDAREQKENLKKDLDKISLDLRYSKIKLILSYLSLVGFFGVSNSIKKDIDNQNNAIQQIKDFIEKSTINLKLNLDENLKKLCDDLYHSFEKLKSSHKIWDVTSEYNIDRVEERSAASTTITRREVDFKFSKIEEVSQNLNAIHLKNANGGDLYFFPCFIVMLSKNNDFAIMGFHEVDISFYPVKFIETENIPNDAEQIDSTWAKVNKNGTPDKRFKDNYQIPIMRYAEFRFQTKTGLNEAYMLSNYKDAESFYNSLRRYQSELPRFK
ncbi:MAG: DUF4236 domain-containing protein [Eikenella sp.]|nr:DUF4236 domain-containing protein [Eikenella sp.]